MDIETIEFGNAAGTVKNLADVQWMCKSAATYIKAGSYTKLPRTGNEPVSPGDVLFIDPETFESGNAIGLKNPGMQWCLEHMPEMIRTSHAAGKKFIVSIVGETIEEIVELASVFFGLGVDGVEINLACPNVHDKGVHKPLMCEDPMLVAMILLALKRAGLAGKRILLKVSPITDPDLLRQLCMAITVTAIVTDVVATNTRGGQRFIRDGKDMLAFRPPGTDEVRHVGGQAGRPIHALAVDVVRQLRVRLHRSVRLFGCGGIFSGDDAYDFHAVGAHGFECATALLIFGPKIFSDIIEGLSDRLV